MNKKTFYLILFLIVIVFGIFFYSVFENKEKPEEEGLLIFSPKKNEMIESPVKIEGEARGFWFFEAEFTTELFDDANNFLGIAILTAKDEWMTESFVPFEGELFFSQPETLSGILKFLSANPTGLPEYQRIFEIPVQLKEALQP